MNNIEMSTCRRSNKRAPTPKIKQLKVFNPIYWPIYVWKHCACKFEKKEGSRVNKIFLGIIRGKEID